MGEKKWQGTLSNEVYKSLRVPYHKFKRKQTISVEMIQKITSFTLVKHLKLPSTWIISFTASSETIQVFFFNNVRKGCECKQADEHILTFKQWKVALVNVIFHEKTKQERSTGFSLHQEMLLKSFENCYHIKLYKLPPPDDKIKLFADTNNKTEDFSWNCSILT